MLGSEVWSVSVLPGLMRRGGGPGVAEGRDDLVREAVEVGALDVERGAERGGANDAVEAGDGVSRPPSAGSMMSSGRPARKPAAFTASCRRTVIELW